MTGVLWEVGEGKKEMDVIIFIYEISKENENLKIIVEPSHTSIPKCVLGTSPFI